MGNSAKMEDCYAVSVLLTETSDECFMEERLLTACTDKVDTNAHWGTNQPNSFLLLTLTFLKNTREISFEALTLI